MGDNFKKSMEEVRQSPAKSDSSEKPSSTFAPLIYSTSGFSLLDPGMSLDPERMGNPRYKTEICRNFKKGSKCIYGDKCQFAHGRRELRDVIRNSKYKTKPCQKYWLIGYCAYGPRCNFLHDEASEQELMDWNSIHNDQSVGSTSRPTTPTTLFEVNHDMVEDTMMTKGSLLSMNYQIHPTPIPSKEINDQGIGVWTAP